jgi:hypothetical protein
MEKNDICGWHFGCSSEDKNYGAIFMRVLKPGRQSLIEEQVAKLAAKEREVRQLEAFIDHISSLDEKQLREIWPRLTERLYSKGVKRQSEPASADSRGLSRLTFQRA